jgi:3',5'-cyclic AMP phosphodiesterase CpdA
MSKAFVLAHLSDPHLGPLPEPDVRELASKRLVGYINWRRSRHRVHRRDTLDAITRDLHGTQPDHVAITGDLVNIALPAEFAHARRWLETLGRPTDVSVVPGNHDAYVAAAGLHRDRHWLPYMGGDAPFGSAKQDHRGHPAAPPQSKSAVADFDHSIGGPKSAYTRFRLGDGRGAGAGGIKVPRSAIPPPDPSPEGGGEKITFPYLRRRGPVALIGVSTAIPTPPFMATGKVGEKQIACVAKMLDDLRTENLFRVVMIHHPPVPSARHKCLIDAVAFQRVIAAVGAELVIHGHDHVHSVVWIAGNGGRVPVIGVPSASASTSTKKRAGAYNLYFISGNPGAWSCEVVSRGSRPSGAVAELNRFALSW